MDNKLLLTDLVQALTDKGFTRKDAEAFVRCFFQQVEKFVFAGESVKINGLGTFKLQKVEPRKSVNVHTGEQIEIEGHYKFSYLPDTDLKEAVNEPYSHLDNAEVDDDAPEAPLFTVYDPEAEASAENVPVENVTSEKVPSEKVSESVSPFKWGLVSKVLCVLFLLAGSVYWFMHTRSRQADNVDSQQITVTADTVTDIMAEPVTDIVAESVTVQAEPEVVKTMPEAVEPESEPVHPKPVTVDITIDNPGNWETMKTVTVGHGDRLTIYALENYGDKIFWVYLFLANQDVLKNPNSLPAGTFIRIPKAPESVINASDPASIEKARAVEVQLKARYD